MSISKYEVTMADNTLYKYHNKEEINDHTFRRMFSLMEQYNENEIEMEDECTLRINSFYHNTNV